MKTKNFLLCLDGARYDIIRKWADEGLLPTFKKIIDNGAHGYLESVLPGPHTAIAWISMATGNKPNKHGYVYTFMPDSENNFKLFDANSINSLKIWDIFSNKGLRVGVMDVPLTYPPNKINGFIVCSCMTPGFATTYTYPKELSKLINNYRGCSTVSCEKPNKRTVQELYNHTEERIKAQNKLLKKYDVDLFLKHYSGTEQLNFIYPSFLDKSSKQYTKESEDIVKKFYIYLDNHFEKLIKQYPDSNFIFFSDHGSTPLKNKIYLNNILQELDLFDPKKTSLKNNKAIQSTIESCAKIYLKLPFKIQKIIRSIIPKDISDKTYKPININANFQRSIAYAFVWGMIFINKQHPDYIPENHEKIVKQVYEKLKAHTLIQKYSQKIYLKEELFDKDSIYAPDIYIRTNDDTKPVYNIDKRKTLEYVTKNNQKTLNGMFLAYGPNIKNIQIHPSIIDLTPTILHLNNIDIPNDISGKVLKEIFTEGSTPYNKNISYSKTNEELKKLKKKLDTIKF